MNFTHLHIHSHYSLLDGLGSIDGLLERVQELGQDAVALTDHGAMYGTIEFYTKARATGIKPIIGVETYIAPRSLKDKDPSLDTKPYHLVLLAKNYQGYKNLLKLVTIAHLEGYYYRPRIDKKILRQYSAGLIGLSSCLQGEVPRAAISSLERAKKIAQEYQDILGKDNFYLEIQDHPKLPEQALVNQRIIQISRQTGIPLIATNDAHYLKPEDAEAHQLLVCVQTGKTIHDSQKMEYLGDFSLRPTEEMIAAFKDTPEAIENTQKIAATCNVEIPLGKEILPDFPLPKDKSADDYLRELAKVGAKERYGTIDNKIKERLNFELETVKKTGFAGYFLIVADFMNFAKKQGILVGPGRGSAAGSLVSYALSITNLDPLKYNLLFERFLNPDRIEMPDIDLDFADDRRGEVIDYVMDKYGRDRVAGIITFGTMAARASVRDTGRALGMAYAEVDRIAKLIPPPSQGRHIPIKDNVRDNPDLREVYTKEPAAKELLELASRLEGTVRHASQHACAVVISKEPLTEYVPLQLAQGGDVEQITQYSMEPIAKIGLLKMDFLGLANLSIIGRALEIIEAVHHKKIDIHSLPLDDRKTFQLLSRGETTGVFQLESAGMKRYIKELKPTSVEDITAMVALYRPGPMQWIDSFIARKRGREEVTYLHPLMEKALENTYGIPIYQEQVMQIAKDLAGFTGGEADTLRKAIGKKIKKLMAEMKLKFIAGGEKKGISRKIAQEIFTRLEDFAAYGFNKSHAACYALIAYQTAYLKTHYPECFMAALLTSDLNDIERIAVEIEECERLGIKVLPPDVQESFVDFGVVKETGNIRFGLAAIKNVGVGVAKAIYRQRKQNGAFKDLADFVKRLAAAPKIDETGQNVIAPVAGSTNVNKKVLEALAKSGALDSLVERNTVLVNMETILKFVSSLSKAVDKAQMGLFAVSSVAVFQSKLILAKCSPADKRTRLNWEKELLGIYLSEHPLREVGGYLTRQASHQIGQLNSDLDGHRVKVAGIITEVKKILTKNGQNMVFAGLEDLTGKTELVVFPRILNDNIHIFAPDKILVAEGRVSDKDGVIKVLPDKVTEVNPDKVPKESIITGSPSEEFEEIDLTGEEIPNSKQSTLNTVISSEARDLAKSSEDDGISPPRPRGRNDNAAICDKRYAISDKQFIVELPQSARKSALIKLKEILERYPGETPVVLRLPLDGNLQEIRTKTKVKVSAELQKELDRLLVG